MASGSPTVSREARESAPETPEAAANLQVFCKLCLSEQPSTATTGLQSCKCIYCTAVGTDDAFRFFRSCFSSCPGLHLSQWLRVHVSSYINIFISFLMRLIISCRCWKFQDSDPKPAFYNLGNLGKCPAFKLLGMRFFFSFFFLLLQHHFLLYDRIQ